MSNKIIEGARQALAFAMGEEPAARITTSAGGPYVQDGQRTLIQHKVGDHYIVWNWNTGRWDMTMTPVRVLR